MDNNSEAIVQKTVAVICCFLKETFNDSVALQFEQRISDWPQTWHRVREWLSQSTFIDKNTTILSFAQSLPEYESIQDPLTQSLTLHDSFWFAVFNNLCEAKKRLHCS